jgi:flagellar basal-body rod protein FlgC
MSTFAAMDIARTGMGFSRYWLDTISHNLANVNTVQSGDEEPFRASYVVAGANTDEIVASGSGVHVAGVELDRGAAAKVYDPTHPLADDEGNIVRPVVDVAGQMADMILAQRSYQLSAKSVTGAKEAYEAALRIGDRR